MLTVRTFHHLLTCFALLAISLAPGTTCSAQNLLPYYYDTGSPQVTEIFVDPKNGSDSRSGSTRSSALRTITEAWNRIPATTTLSTGYRINLLPGTYGDTAGKSPSYWELKRGTFVAPIILQAVDGQGTVTFTTDINMANVSYFYLINITISRGGDTFHCEGCDHILLRGNTLIGAPSGRTVGTVAHETIKFNQSQHIYIESNRVQGAEDNAIDWVAVQHGHIVANSISDAQGWCAYVKGGSAYVRIEGNEFSNCFEGGITAGQGTGLEYMTGPWFRYEAYDVKIINNVIHDITGAALGVNGGYNILLAHNTAYRIGSRSHLVEVVFGYRSCDENPTACLTRVTSGAWGPSTVGASTEQSIGNRNIKALNNILYNPSGFAVGDQHFAIYGPRAPTVSGIPSPQHSDIELEIKGNLIWNGAQSHPLGIEGPNEGCQPSNTSCNEIQLRSENFINVVEPELNAPADGDLRPKAGSAFLTLSPAVLSPFTSRSPDETTPEGIISNLFTRDRSGSEATALVVGAYSSASAELLPPTNSNSPIPKAPQVPTITSLSAKSTKVGRRYRIALSCIVTSTTSHSSVSARLSNCKRFSLTKRGSKYVQSVLVRSASRLLVTVSVKDVGGSTMTKTVSVSRR